MKERLLAKMTAYQSLSAALMSQCESWQRWYAASHAGH